MNAFGPNGQIKNLMQSALQASFTCGMEITPFGLSVFIMNYPHVQKRAPLSSHLTKCRLEIGRNIS